MADLPILGYKRHPRPMLHTPKLRYHKSQELTKENHTTVVEKVTGTKNDNYDLGVYLDNELQRLENSFDTNTQQTNVLDVGVKEIKQTIIDINNTTGANTAAISQEAITRTSADSALASLVTTLTATVATGDSTNASAITSEATARADADTAIATDITNLTATVTNNNNTLSAAVTSEATARADADTATASSINTVSASVTTEANARIAADNTITASVTTEASARVAADNTLLAKYGVTLNSNGYITGFAQNNDGTTGTFKIIADEFKIIDPGNAAGQAGIEVFGVSGGYATIKNIRSAASGARLQIDSDVMSVFDASDVLRVKLGNLS